MTRTPEENKRLDRAYRKNYWTKTKEPWIWLTVIALILIVSLVSC